MDGYRVNRVLRVSVRMMMLLVAFVGVFLAGYKLGQQRPAIDGPGPRAMYFVGAQRLASEKEAAALYDAAKMAETSRPGMLLKRPWYTYSSLSDPIYAWKVEFLDRETGKLITTIQGTNDDTTAFIKKRDEGFRLVSE